MSWVGIGILCVLAVCLGYWRWPELREALEYRRAMQKREAQEEERQRRIEKEGASGWRPVENDGDWE